MNKDNVTKSVQRKLFELQDVEYRDFHARLMPTVEKEKIIGIRIPVLRKFAKEYAKSEDAGEFIKILPHDYYEENNLHGFLIEGIKDYEECIRALDIFLPYVFLQLGAAILCIYLSCTSRVHALNMVYP